MFYCFVCGGVGKGTIRFPKQNEKLCLWLNALGLKEKPPENARICADHFRTSDISVKFGKRVVSDDAIPFKEIKTESPSSDHNYSLNSKNEEEEHFPWELFLCVTLALLFLFDYLLSPSCKSSKSSATPISTCARRGRIFQIVY